MTIKKLTRYLSSIIILSFLLVNSTFAAYVGGQTGQDLIDQMNKTGSTGYQGATPGPTSMAQLVATIISAFLGLLGIIFVILIIYAGYNWMTASGDEEKVNKAKATLTQAVIGLIIIIAAYSITYFIFSNLPGGTGGGSPSGGQGYQINP